MREGRCIEQGGDRKCQWFYLGGGLPGHFKNPAEACCTCQGFAIPDNGGGLNTAAALNTGTNTEVWTGKWLYPKGTSWHGGYDRPRAPFVKSCSIEKSGFWCGNYASAHKGAAGRRGGGGGAAELGHTLKSCEKRCETTPGCVEGYLDSNHGHCYIFGHIDGVDSFCGTLHPFVSQEKFTCTKPPAESGTTGGARPCDDTKSFYVGDVWGTKALEYKQGAAGADCDGEWERITDPDECKNTATGLSDEVDWTIYEHNSAHKALPWSAWAGGGFPVGGRGCFTNSGHVYFDTGTGVSNGGHAAMCKRKHT